MTNLPVSSIGGTRCIGFRIWKLPIMIDPLRYLQICSLTEHTFGLLRRRFDWPKFGPGQPPDFKGIGVVVICQVDRDEFHDVDLLWTHRHQWEEATH